MGALLLAVIGGIAVALLITARGRASGARDVCDNVAATLYAEACAALYLDQVNSGAIPREDLERGEPPTLRFVGPDRDATVECDAGAYPLGLELTSVARSGGRAVRVTVRGAPGPATGSPVGLGALDSVHLRSRAEVDAFRSAAGPYRATRSPEARVGAAGGVRVDRDAAIHGDVIFGALSGVGQLTGALLGESSPELALVDAEVDEALAAASASNQNARLAAAVLATGGGWTLAGGVLRSEGARPPPLVVPAGVYALAGIDADRDARIELAAGETALAVSGPVRFRRGAALVVRQGAEAALYLRGRATLNGALPSGQTADDALLRPAALRILGHTAAGALTIADGSVLFASIQWPGGEVEVGEDARLFGELIGGEVDLGRGARLHLDLALGGGAARARPFAPASFRKEAID